MMGKSKEVSIDSMGFKVIDRGQQKLAKLCVVCQRQFTWRKKWEHNWKDVTVCSDRCKRQKTHDKSSN